MPEMQFKVRWPDGVETVCYSPSLVIREYFETGTAYPLDDFVDRSRTALGLASERVQARYGMPCSRALSQIQRIEHQARTFASQPDGKVVMVSFHDGGA